MKTKWFLLARFMLPCLFLVISVPLRAQQSSPPWGQPSSPPPPRVQPPSPPGPATTAQKPPAASLAQKCQEYLKPLKAAPLPADPLNDTGGSARRSEAEVQLTARFMESSDGQLFEDELQLRKCVTDLPDRRSRRDALDAYILIVREQESRVVKAKDDNYLRLAELAAGRGEEVKKEHDNFLEAAKFAAALWKQNEAYKEQESKLLLALRDERKDYDAMYKLAGEAINLAGQALGGPPRPSLPVFVNVPAPQVIRVETPPVPKALHCSANTTPNLSMLPELYSTSTTWINCWQY